MAEQSLQQRIRTTEIFGVLVPGFHVLATVATLLRSDEPVCQQNLAMFRAFLPTNMDLTTLGTAILAAYVLGTIVRAFPMPWIDNPIGYMARSILGRPKRNPGRLVRIYDRPFPYLPELLHHAQGVSGATSALSEDPNFEYWKVSLAIKCPQANQLVEEFESRTRLFHGLIVSSFLGVLSPLLASLVQTRQPGAPLTCVYAWCSFSALLLAVLAFRFRHVRAKEAVIVFLAYVVGVYAPNLGDDKT